VRRALEIDDNLAEAHGTLGYQYMLDYNWVESERHMKRALELDPKNNAELYRWNGQRLMMLGRYDESLTEYKRALEIDPNSTPVHFIYGSCLIASGQLDKGIEYLENTIKADPTFVWSHSQLSFGYRFKNDFARATEQRAIAQDLLGETENAKLTRESFAKGGRDGFLREMIRQGNNPDGITGGMRTASSLALLGENEKAISMLQHLAEGGDFWLFQIKYDPAYENLKTDPRFQALVRIFDAK
jgi:tetratricopeptide (TPR) repeat protein